MNLPNFCACVQQNPMRLLLLVNHPLEFWKFAFQLETIPSMLMDGAFQHYGPEMFIFAQQPRSNFKNVPLESLAMHLHRLHQYFAPAFGPDNPMFNEFTKLLKVRGILPYDLPEFPVRHGMCNYIMEAIDFHNGNLLLGVLTSYNFNENDQFADLSSETLDFLHALYLASPLDVKEKLLEKKDLRLQDRRFFAAFHEYPSMRAFLERVSIGSLVEAVKVLVKDGLQEEIRVLMTRMTARGAQSFVVEFIVKSGHSNKVYAELLKYILSFQKQKKQLAVLEAKRVQFDMSRIITAALSREKLIPFVQKNHWKIVFDLKYLSENLIRNREIFTKMLEHFPQQVIGYQAYCFRLINMEIVKRQIILGGGDAARYFRGVFNRPYFALSDYSMLINLSVYGKVFREVDNPAFRTAEEAMIANAAFQTAFEQVLQLSPSITRYLSSEDLHLVKVITSLESDSLRFLSTANLDSRFNRYTPPEVESVDSDNEAG